MTGVKIVATIALAASVCAGQDRGITPRTDPRLYHGHEIQNDLEIGATVLSTEQVKNAFASGLNRGYVVLEVALYPKNGVQPDVRLSDFALHTLGTDQVTRPVRASTVAGILQKTAPSRTSVEVDPVVAIGYESGTRNDPYTGEPRRGGFYSTSGVAVSTGRSRPGSTDRDRRTVELELSEQGLPEGIALKPVAGYVYFPLASKKKDAAYELEYQTPAGPVRLVAGRR